MLKLLVTKQRATVLFLLTLLILLDTSNIGYAQDKVQTIPTTDPPLSERTPQIRDAIVAAVPGVNNADDVTAAHLAAITKLNPIFREITSLKSGDFNGLTGLTFLGLSANGLTSLPPGIFDELTALTYLGLSVNELSGLPSGIFDELTALKTLALSINKLGALPPGIFDELTALNYLGLGANKLTSLPPGIFDELTALETLFLHSNNISDISELEGLTTLAALQLSRNPISDYEPLRRLVAAITAAGRSLKLDITIPPKFMEGTSTTRTIAENMASGTNIGTAVTATDMDGGDTLTYSLGGTDAPSFGINTATGQLQTKAALDYETKPSYAVTVSVSDSKGGTDSIDVTITVIDVEENSAPAFTDGDTTTRSVAENTPANTDIGTAISATDADNDTLTYSLGGTDASSFGINTTTGQLQTKAALDYETKPSYAVTVSVSDGNGGTDSITVTVNVMDVAEIDPPLSERTQQVRDTIVAAIPGVDNADDVTPTHLAAITKLHLHSQGITSLKSDDFNGLTTLTELYLSFNSIKDISALEGLTTLTELDLRNMSIKDISALEGLTNLTELYLSFNSISDVSALERLTNLTELNLSSNSISDISALERLTNLKNLNLSSNSISDISALRGLTNLTSLSLILNSISDISALEGLTDLTSLGLAFNSISDISALEGLTNLTSLGLKNNSISDISALEGLTDLTNLYLSGNSISDYGPLRRLIAAIQADGGSLKLDITIPAAPAAPSVETPPIIPDRTALLTNFPNPFNPETWIPYQLAKPAEVTLTIYDIRGVVVRELKLGHQPAGVYHSRSRAIHWDGRNAFGEKVATGVYFYTLHAGDYTATRKLLIRK